MLYVPFFSLFKGVHSMGPLSQQHLVNGFVGSAVPNSEIVKDSKMLRSENVGDSNEHVRESLEGPSHIESHEAASSHIESHEARSQREPRKSAFYFGGPHASDPHARFGEHSLVELGSKVPCNHTMIGVCGILEFCEMKVNERAIELVALAKPVVGADRSETDGNGHAARQNAATNNGTNSGDGDDDSDDAADALRPRPNNDNSGPTSSRSSKHKSFTFTVPHGADRPATGGNGYAAGGNAAINSGDGDDDSNDAADDPPARPNKDNSRSSSDRPCSSRTSHRRRTSATTRRTEAVEDDSAAAGEDRFDSTAFVRNMKPVTSFGMGGSGGYIQEDDANDNGEDSTNTGDDSMENDDATVDEENDDEYDSDSSSFIEMGKHRESQNNHHERKYYNRASKNHDSALTRRPKRHRKLHHYDQKAGRKSAIVDGNGDILAETGEASITTTTDTETTTIKVLNDELFRAQNGYVFRYVEAGYCRACPNYGIGCSRALLTKTSLEHCRSQCPEPKAERDADAALIDILLLVILILLGFKVIFGTLIALDKTSPVRKHIDDSFMEKQKPHNAVMFFFAPCVIYIYEGCGKSMAIYAAAECCFCCGGCWGIYFWNPFQKASVGQPQEVKEWEDSALLVESSSDGDDASLKEEDKK